MYARFGKRALDFLLALTALLILSPVLLVLTVVGAVCMKGSPFFVQPRPGKNGKIFRLVKFRTMTSQRDANGELLPDAQRLVPYGRFLRRTSLDELPELLNVLAGQMSLVGPRPLLVKYLPLYNEEQRHRHDVRPGLTGYAQAYGRNALTWEDRFQKDIYYVNNVSFVLDMKILWKTVAVVLKREGISSQTSETMEAFTGKPKGPAQG